MTMPGAASGHVAAFPGHQPPPPVHVKHPARPGAVKALVWVAVGAVLGLSALVTIAVIGVTTGPAGALVGLLLATLPIVPVAASLLWLDRFEDEPRALLFFAFGWGATAAVVISLVLSIGTMIAIGNAPGAEETATVFVAPVIEESAKGLAVLGVLLIRRREFDGVVDGIVYAGLAGLGFAFAENILYLGGAFLDGGLPGALGLFLVRCVMGPFAHPMFTAALGIGVGLAVRTRNPLGKVLYPLFGLAVAMLLHGSWNALAVQGGETFLTGYVVLQMPIFLGFVVFAVMARRREARLIARHLQAYVTSGWLTGTELTMLSSTDGRRRARAWAGRTAGSTGKRAMRDFQELGSELAFLRERMEHRAARPDAQQEELDLLQTMWHLRSGFLPAPAR